MIQKEGNCVDASKGGRIKTGSLGYDTDFAHSIYTCFAVLKV